MHTRWPLMLLTATVVVAAAQTVLAAGYYLRPFTRILVEAPHRASAHPGQAEPGTLTALALCAAVTLILGVWPGLILGLIS